MKTSQEREIAALDKLVKALEGLLVCYRTGSHRHADQVLTRLEKAREDLRRIREGGKEQQNG